MQEKIKLSKSLDAWNSPAFEATFKEEVRNLEKPLLQLQAGLRNSSYVSDTPIEPMILMISETAHVIIIKAGIFYGGIDAGSCCVDDPTPICEENEFCELRFDIDKKTAEVSIHLLNN